MGVLQRLDSALDFEGIGIPMSVLASFLGWFSLYCVLCLANSKRSYEWHCRVVTGVHAVVISTLSYVFGMYYNPWFITNPGGRNNNLEILTLVICMGYFLFDFCWCLWFREEVFMIAHHFLTIVCVTASLALGISGTEVGAAIFGSEVSNPMLQARYFMRETGYTKTLVYEINDLAFMITFFVCRMGIGTFFIYSYLRHPAPLFIFRVGSIGLYIVSLIFMYGIARLAVRKYGGFLKRLVGARKSHAKVRNGDASKQVTRVTGGQVKGVTEGQQVTGGPVKEAREGQESMQLNGHANDHEHTD
nr:TLC domain-containing protein 5-like [Lytechinus pictus]